MTTPINTSAFSANLRSNPNFNAWISLFQKSPTLANDINTLASSGGVVQMAGQAGLGTSTAGKTISFDPGVIAALQSGAGNQLELAAALAHELGHAIMPHGEDSVLQPGTLTPADGAKFGLNDEGVALENEYKVARELNTNMYSGSVGGANSPLASTLNSLAQTDGISTAKFDTDAIAAGARYTSTLTPSVAPNLTYQKYYEDQWIVGVCSDIGKENVDWKNTKSSDITYTNSGGSCQINMNSIKLLGGDTATVTGSTSNSNGAPVSTLETVKDSSGDIKEKLTDANNASTEINYDYNGQQSYTKDTISYTGLNATGNKIEDIDDTKFLGISVDTKYDFNGSQSYTKDTNWYTGADDTGSHISEILDSKFLGWSQQTQFDYDGKQNYTKDMTTWTGADATGAKVEDVDDTKFLGISVDTKYDWSGQLNYTKDTANYTGADKTGNEIEDVNDTKFFGISVDTRFDYNGQQNYTKDTQWYTGADKAGALMEDRDDTKFLGICTDTHYDWNNTLQDSKSVDYFTGTEDTGSKFQTMTDYDNHSSDLLQYDYQNNQLWKTDTTDYSGQDLSGAKAWQLYDWDSGASSVDVYDASGNQSWNQVDFNFSQGDAKGNETSRTIDWDGGGSTLYDYDNGVWDVYSFSGADDTGAEVFDYGYYGSDATGGGYYYYYDKVNQAAPKGRNGIDQISVYDNALGKMRTVDLTKAVDNSNNGSAHATTSGNKAVSPAYRSNLEGATWGDKTITWSFADHNTSGQSNSAFSGFIQNQYQADIEQAMQTWAKASGLTFKEVSDSQASDIRIGWGDLNTSTTNTIGLTDLKKSQAQLNGGAVVRLEDPSQLALTKNAQGQYTYSGTDATLNQVALHELGHALGLGVNGDPNSIMYANSTSANRTLDATDIAGIQSLYDYSSVVSQAPAANDTSSASSINVNGYNINEHDLMLATSAAR